MNGIAKRHLAFAAALLGAVATLASFPAQAARGGSSARGSHASAHSHSHHRHHAHGYRRAPAVAYYAPRVTVAPRPAYVAPAYVAPVYVAPAYVPAPVYVPPPAVVAPAPYGGVPPPPAPSAGTWRTIAGPFLAVDGASFVAGGVTYVLSGIHTFDPSTPQGAAARARLQQLLSGGAVQVWRIAVDGYGRSVARVVVNGADLSAKLRQEGHGRA